MGFSHIDYLGLAADIIRPQWRLYSLGLVAGVGCSLIVSVVHRSASAMMAIGSASPDFLDLMRLTLFLNLVAGCASMVRGGLFTVINQRLYTTAYRRFFAGVTRATMAEWDTVTQLVEADLSKVALADLSEVVVNSSLAFNVVTRTSATILASLWLLQSATELAGICVAIGIAHVTCVHYSHARLAVYTEAARKARQDQQNHVNSYIQNHVSLQLYSMQAAYLDVFDGMTPAYETATVKEAVAYAGLIFSNHIVLHGLETGFKYAIFYYGYGARALEILAYYHMIADALGGIKEVVASFTRSMDAAERVQRCLRMGLDPGTGHQKGDDQVASRQPLSISFDAISFGYPKRDPIFNGFTFHVGPGEKVAVVAPSGSGKTTLLKLLLNMYPVSAGQIRIGDRDVRGIPVTELRRLVSIVPQEPLFFPQKTLRENILMICGTAVSDLDRVLEKARLHDFVKLLDEKLPSLSGGQKQRLAIARVLATDTPIVVFDEPTSALDEENTRALMKEIEVHCEDKTVIFITHKWGISGFQLRELKPAPP